MAGIFLAGAIAGGAGAIAWTKHDSKPRSAREIVDSQLKKRVEQLELNEEQIARIKPIMAVYEETFRLTRRKCFHEIGQVFSAMNARIEGELTPEQHALFRAIQEEERKRFEKRIQSRPRDSDSGKQEEGSGRKDASSPGDAPRQK